MKTRIRGLGVAASLMLAFSGGCDNNGNGNGGDTSSGGGPDFDRNVLFKDFADNVAVPALVQAATRAGELSMRVAAYRQAVTGAAQPATGVLADARVAWREAMIAWQAAEVLQIGPLSMEPDGVNAGFLRDEIYSWPLVNPCRVDQEVVAERFRQDDFIANANVLTYGLDALEYLLFNESLENACPAQVNINSEGTWDALSDAEIMSRRAAYAEVVAMQIAADTAKVRDGWNGTGDDFAVQLAEAGRGDSPYQNTQQAADEILAALFYLEKETKDLKLGEPLGLVGTTCVSSPPCPGELETPFAEIAGEAILANLRIFRQALTGGGETATGFDDYLAARNAESLANEFVGNVDTAITAFEGVSTSLHDVLRNDPDQARALFDALKAVTDILKGDFATVLQLQIPREASGDGD